MADIASIASAVAGIKNATDIANLIRGSEKTLEHAEVKARLADLIGALADTKMQLANVKDDVMSRDERIRELERGLKLRGMRVYEEPNYWLVAENGTKEGPYCQQCQDSVGKWIRLQIIDNGSWQCMTCEKIFTNADYRNRPMQRVADHDYDPFES